MSQLYKPIHYFFIFFSIMVYLRILNIFPYAIHQDLVVEFAPTNPKFPTHPLPYIIFPLTAISLFSMSLFVWKTYFRFHIYMISYGIWLSLTQYDNLQLYLCWCKWHYFILFMTKQYSIVYMYHIFFMNASVDGHLGCLIFWLL